MSLEFWLNPEPAASFSSLMLSLSSWNRSLDAFFPENGLVSRVVLDHQSSAHLYLYCLLSSVWTPFPPMPHWTLVKIARFRLLSLNVSPAPLQAILGRQMLIMWAARLWSCQVLPWGFWIEQFAHLLHAAGQLVILVNYDHILNQVITPTILSHFFLTSPPCHQALSFDHCWSRMSIHRYRS